MITVAIFINGAPIISRSAVNKGTDENGMTKYEVDDGKVIMHKRSEGAIALAKKLLKGVKESK